jgi:membrane-associated phospholipid phosphatase
LSRRAAAERVTYLLEPKNWIIVTVLAVGWNASGLTGLAWGAVAALFAAVIPTLFISRGVRNGTWRDRNVGERRPRLIVLGFILASVAIGLAVLRLGGAPGELTGYFGCMLVSLALLAAITTVWKISIHCSVAAAAVTILTMIFGAWLSPAYVLVVLTGWSRVELKDHTVAQVVAGSVLGVAAAIVSYLVIKG